ncbi:MAG TPA: hypothetical protein DIU15_21185, partial [Deltaproteobacteria bacterium]|nr:hypothetical protein [Deltaproteobacteria bacterium]
QLLRIEETLGQGAQYLGADVFVSIGRGKAAEADSSDDAAPGVKARTRTKKRGRTTRKKKTTATARRT